MDPADDVFVSRCLTGCCGGGSRKHGAAGGRRSISCDRPPCSPGIVSAFVSSGRDVICAKGRVVGDYALATGAIARTAATGKVRRQMPDPIPVMIIGRLAVDTRHQGHGLGYGLLRDALLRILQVAAQAGIRAVLLHAMTADAKRFYQRAGFRSHRSTR